MNSAMHFCTNCENMYYIKISKDDSNLVYYCRHCGHEDEALGKQNMYVSQTFLNKDSKNFSNYINKYTKLDPTLPRIHNMPCPNDACVTNKDDSVERNVILIRYNEQNLNYLYLCTHCDKVWTL
jgi:DNA-directed RNA polymerase subunit M/transcription elongation factor TFIIS